MDDEVMILTVRAFSRVVTQRVGALDDRYLARDRPLAEARVLWEIGDRGRDVRTLRSRLELDSGYLSRILRSLEASGLITMTPSQSDKRVRTARLTRKGEAEWDLLDRRSDALARSMLAPLGQSQRERLALAMSEVERLLRAATVEIKQVDPAHADAQYCLRQYFLELDRRFDAGFNPAASLPTEPEDMRPPAGLFLVVTAGDEPVGCGALKFHGDQPTELKRMWVSPDMRGLGVGHRLLQELERRAAERPSPTIRLDTNGSLTEAIAMYQSAGYQAVGAYNDEPYANLWFEKQLGPPVAVA